jgi:predicted nucleic acid-binding protein
MAQHPLVWLTPLHRAEWTHAVAQHIFHSKISSQQARKVYRDFERDRAAGIWVEVDLPDMAFETCVKLARQYVGRLGVRTLDSLHVASALELEADGFWTFDARQAKLAEATGLKTT